MLDESKSMSVKSFRPISIKRIACMLNNTHFKKISRRYELLKKNAISSPLRLERVNEQNRHEEISFHYQNNF